MAFLHYYDTKDPALLWVENEEKTLKLRLNCQNGFTVEQWDVDNISYIDCDLVRAAKGATYGIPLLYPTPNRVKNNQFIWCGKEYYGVMHGVIRHQSFLPVQIETQSDKITVRAQLLFAKGTALYQQFPFESVFYIALEITDKSLTWRYQIQNNDALALPYSFALHPFFYKHGATWLKTAVQGRMEADAENYPTGKVFSIEGTIFDANQSADVEILPEVSFLNVSKDALAKEMEIAKIQYVEHNVCIKIKASDAFEKLVVFAPKGNPWFCVEPQTSAVDCHNFYDQGFVSQSNLQIVAPNTTANGYVSFSIE